MHSAAKKNKQKEQAKRTSKKNKQKEQAKRTSKKNKQKEQAKSIQKKHTEKAYREMCSKTKASRDVRAERAVRIKACREAWAVKVEKFKKQCVNMQ